jgi:hypothetical protein
VQAWLPLGPREPYHPWYHHGPRYRDRVNPDITDVPSRDVHYVNRPELTAVPLGAFQGGESVGRRVVRLSAGDADRASVIAHPRVMPLTRAAVGRPAPKPPVVPRPKVEVTPWRRPPAVAPAPRPTPRPAPPARRVPPPVIARNPPAPQALPFPKRQQGMRSDPGRPLEPEQRRNIREGKPVGPHRDAEEPPDRRPAAPKPQAPRPKKPQ